ncbi:helix-turn-helix domain-containing protein [Ruegeria lacuscaerulensis]|uniref:helix-turn-helix domain-containing protein n=1 Tax=Ruegeria lacuscaerulensis TaxID=55218 RepID=UPI00147D95DB|nr:helix-turn-helix domain-containing protein [Ruegeria lacuscaerulensis]
MKHYVLRNDHAHLARTAPSTPERIQNIDVILSDPEAKASTEMVVEFFRALNDLVEDYTYIVNFRKVAEDTAGGPLYWAGRTAIFWGDIHKNWQFKGRDKAWITQVMNLSSRSIFVGGAVLLLAQTGRADGAIASIHPNFSAAAQEVGLIDCGTGTHKSVDGRTHSASTKLSALTLMSEFVSLDHGEHLADTLRSYIGLTEPKRTCASQLAVRLIQRSGADPMVRQVIDKMLDNVEDPLRISDLSQSLGTSTRQLQRRFLHKTGVKLLTTYRELRLERAHSLLRYTDMPQLEISTATGFSSAAALGRAFRAHYKTTPEDVRSRRYAGHLSDQHRTH